MVHENIKVIFDVENEHDPEFVGVTVTEEVEFEDAEKVAGRLL